MTSPRVPGCLLCGRPTYDPDKRERPWSRAVARGQQVLICPGCQAEQADWQSRLDRCPNCGSIRLGVMLGEIVCRQCGYVGASQAEPGA